MASCTRAGSQAFSQPAICLRAGRKRAPETPYYLRNAAKERKPRQGLAGARHVFDDDLSETAEEQSSVVPGNARNRAKAIALAINGVLMFVLSAL